MALADFVVVEVVRRGDLHAAGTESRIDVGVGDDRDIAPGERQLHPLSDQVTIAFIFRVHRDRGIAEHGFGARGGNHQVAAAVAQRVAQVPHAAVFFLGDDLEVGYRGVQLRIPVDEPLAAIDQPFPVQAHEHLAYRLRELRVHREAFARPVDRVAEPALLARDIAAGMLLPLPHAAGEFLAPEREPVAAFGRQQPLHDHLGGDARMIGAALPQGVVAAHPVMADQGVHDGLLECMPHVQVAGHIGRWDRDAVGSAGSARTEIPALFPFGVPAVLDFLGLVGLVHGVAQN